MLLSSATRLLMKLFILNALFGISAMSGFDFEMNESLPMDKSIRVGTLENGLKYYIKRNDEPENRVSLRLGVNAGSLQEEHDQRGLAHFLEHMAFNGTRRFEKHEVITFLEGVGMRFGAHLNAYTSFDETVYMLELPADDEEVLMTGFDILEDWAGAISIDPMEVENERGVIVEEWRSRRGAQQRIQDNQYPAIFYDSDYAKRLPIGSTFVIRNAPAHRLEDFYRDWYRPDLMAVVVVGAMDVDLAEKMIIERFSELENPEEPKERVLNEIPDHDETVFSIQEDPEMTGASLTVLHKSEVLPDGTGENYRSAILRRLFFGMLNRRLGERTMEAAPPFMGASVSQSPLGRTKSSFYYSVQFLDDKYQEGIDALISEINRVKRDGFTEGELKRMKQDMMRSIDRIFEEIDNTPSEDLAAEYLRNFFQGEPVPGIELERDLTQAFLAEIESSEISEFARNLPTGEKNRVILFVAPQRADYKLPSEEGIQEMLDKASNVTMAVYDDSVSEMPLLGNEPAAGKIDSEVYHEEAGVYEWTLSNGARVFLKPTDFKNDQVVMNATSPGGHSQVMDDEYLAAAVATMILGEGGLGEFDVVNLEKKLAGKVVQVSPFINGLYEGLTGGTSQKDLDTFFKLVHLQVTQPRLDYESYSSLLTRLAGVLENRYKSPQVVFQDQVVEALYGSHPRHDPLTVDSLKLFDPELSMAVYKDRFSDVSDFDFVFVGSIDVDAFRPYIEKYLASLPATNRIEKGVSVEGTPKDGQTKLRIKKGLEDKSVVRVQFFGEADWSVDNRYALMVARDVLNIRLRNILREEKGGTYGVSVNSSISREPEERFSTGFSFSCDPNNVDIMIAMAKGEIERLKKDGPSDEDLSKVREIHLRGIENGLKDNGFWLQSLVTLLKENRDLSQIFDSEKRIKSLKAEAVQEAFKNYFSNENSLEAILDPQI